MDKTGIKLTPQESTLPRRQKRAVLTRKIKEKKWADDFREWEAEFSNKFANALKNADKHDNDIFAIFDRYWRMGVAKGNQMAKFTMFNAEWFYETHMDNDPNSKINQEA